MNKIFYIILDGAAGKPNKSLNNMSALQAAVTPNIDKLFHKSINGLMHVIGPSIAPQSDVALFALLGYNPFNVPSRGVIEAIGSGVNYVNGEVALRCNITHVSNNKLSGVRLVDLTDDEGKLVEELINNGVSLDVPFTFKHSVGYRGVLVLHAKLSSDVTNTHPGYIRKRIGDELVGVAVKINNKIKECKPLTPNAKITADIINDFIKQSHEVLSKAGLKANYILTRGAGNHLPNLKSFKDKYGLKMALVAKMPVELGVARIIGVDTINETSDYHQLAINVADAINDYDIVYVHIKGPDVYGHIGDAVGKKKAIERIDKEFFPELLNRIRLSDTTICVTSDHATPACVGGHSSDPVPYLITNNKSNTGHFSESSVEQSFIEGKELLNKIISIAKQ